jgi:hypothetical protein
MSAGHRCAESQFGGGCPSRTATGTYSTMMVPFVELNTDGTPIGLLTVQKDMRVIKSRQSIDPSGMVVAPSQSAGVCTRLR